MGRFGPSDLALIIGLLVPRAGHIPNEGGYVDMGGHGVGSMTLGDDYWPLVPVACMVVGSHLAAVYALSNPLHALISPILLMRICVAYYTPLPFAIN